MGFGKNPHVVKAENAEQKALEARDELARAQAWREAARFWERAAEREADGKRRALYTQKSEAARAEAERAQATSAQPHNERLEIGRSFLSTRPPKPKSELLN